MTDNAPRKRNLWKRVVLWITALLALLLLAIFAMLTVIAYRPSPIHTTITPAEIAAEDARLEQLGLVLRDGSFLKPHPFEPPWTSHSLLIPPTWTEPGIQSLLNRHVRADQLLANLDVLQPVMERAYGGWDSAAARGWNWAQWGPPGWRKQLAARGTEKLSLDEAFAPMDTLLAFQRDNHTQIPLNRHTGDGSQTALLAATPTSPCTEIRASGRTFPIAANDAAQQVRTAKQWTPGATFTPVNYIAMPISYGTPQALHCGDAWIPLQPIGDRWSGTVSFLHALWDETLNHEPAHFERLGDGIVYARLPTFASHHYEQLSQQNWPQRQPSDRVLIIDLRDNRGGAAGYGLALLKNWVDESRMVDTFNFVNQVDSSCLHAPLHWGPGSLDDKQSAQGLLDRMARPYPPGCPRTVDIKPPQWTYLQRHFAPGPHNLRIVALVDSQCGSDCELLTALLASLPETIVAGDNTYGVGRFIQPVYSVLPHTGLRYRMSSGRNNFYGDNRSVDGYGLDVDIVLPDVDSLKPAQLREFAEAVARL